MSQTSEESTKKGHTYLQWTFSIISNIAYLNYGLQNGWISPFAKKLQSEDSPTGRPLTSTEFYWVASVSSLAAMFGVSAFAALADGLGRKIGVVAVAAVQALCWIIKLCPSTTVTLIIARICSGLGAGGAFAIVPMYIKEISQNNIRGTLGVIMTISQNAGYLIMYSMGAYMEYYTVLWIAAVPPILNLLLMLFAPESPAFLLKKGKVSEATEVIAGLRGLNIDDNVVLNEINEIRKEDDFYKSIPNISFFGIFKQPVWRRGFLIMFVIITTHGLNGVFTIVTYASTILRASGITLNPELQLLSIPTFMIISSALSITLVERMGRKFLLAGTYIVSAFACGTLATTLLMQENGFATPGWLPIVAIVATVSCYAAGILPLPFVIMSEMFNFQIRAKVMSCIITTGWLMSFVQAASFGPITEILGSSAAFYFFAFMNFFGAVAALFFLPETKGKSVEEIEFELKGK
ncbi:facilitated trehalose transporter Tret1-like [Bombyx mandarina]|uniref:Facilitated trehalose transporter Tret1-like n=1 Tax=Bombyx mandarina TaxID=7092 RepID=A0A6J2KH76_BOMMA|nr:facilitated trehalose transporter Tret1-like [Bombyx mandarina]